MPTLLLSRFVAVAADDILPATGLGIGLSSYCDET
jgi:hypothetical protein